ncbi:putative bifunctional diguanylate cyclase/phosphodiesterase [Blastococcus sp. SYSU D00820]
MDRQRWWLLASTVLAVVACTVATLVPGWSRSADAVVVGSGLLSSVVLWRCAATRGGRGLRGWRLIALAPLCPLGGYVLNTAVTPSGPVQEVLLHWLPAVPGYLLAALGVLTLVGPQRLRTGARGAVETALFAVACLIGVQLLVLGPDGGWTGLTPAEQLVVPVAVVANASFVVAALVLLASVEGRRQRMATLLLAGALLLTAGRALGTSAMLSGATVPTDVGRLLGLGGLALMVLAALADPGPSAAGPDRERTGRSTQLGQVLPHVAMFVAVVAVGSIHLLGSRPSAVSTLGAVVCVALSAVHRCVTARDEQLLGARLRRSEAYFRSLVWSSSDAVLILDGELRIVWASPTSDTLLGCTPGATIGRDLLALAHQGDALPLVRALHGPAPADTPASILTLRLPHADGTWRYVEASVADLRDDPDVRGVVLHCRDTTERHEREQRLEDVAFTDPSTGLPNRAGCARVLQQALDTGTADGRTLLLIEVDGLALVREDAGRDLATSVLAELARRLRATVRGEDLVARLGGDAFAVLTTGDDAVTDQLADRCLSVVEQPVLTSAGIYDLSGNVGIVPITARMAVHDVMEHAELAVGAARRDGPGTATRYTPALGYAAARRARLREDLPGASARGELSVAYQPIVSLEEQRVVGVEALLRWRHPDLGDVPPAEFVAIAERAGVIVELQRWALEQAATVVGELPSTGAPLRLGVNISAAHVAARTLVGDVASVLRCTGLAPERLILEITEATLLADGDDVAADVEALRLMGVHVALDDFGTGGSSVTHLTRLPLDILKLDRALVTRIDRDPRSRALCESIVAIGRALGLDIVAEGVETPAQLGVLRGLGCGFAQGFLLARPMRPADLRELLATGAGSLWPGLVGSR